MARSYRCSDMALVSFLKLNGHTPQRCYWDEDGQTVYWEFVSIAALVKLTEEFHSGQASVEPREYNRLFQQTKKELYAQADPHRGNHR